MNTLGPVTIAAILVVGAVLYWGPELLDMWGRFRRGQALCIGETYLIEHGGEMLELVPTRRREGHREPLRLAMDLNLRHGRAVVRILSHEGAHTRVHLTASEAPEVEQALIQSTALHRAVVTSARYMPQRVAIDLEYSRDFRS